MAGTIQYIGLNRFDSKVTVKNGGAEVTGSLNVEGAILEKGYSIPVLMEKMVVDRLGDDGGTPTRVWVWRALVGGQRTEREGFSGRQRLVRA